MKPLRRAAALGGAALCLLVSLTSAHAATLRVQPGDDLAATLRRAVDGDVVELAAGEYHGQVAVIEQKRLTLRGVGGRPVLHADGRHAEGKAILVVRNGSIRIENIEFRGARVPDGNGAGIRFEKGRLEVSRCAFFDNENGILTANFADADLSVEDSVFGQAPGHVKLPHLIYVGRIGHFTLSGSSFSGGHQAHLVKSRALRSDILYNRLIDGPGGSAAYELEFPNGGLAFVIGNLIGQARDTSNPVVVSFGAEGSDDREQGLFMAHNTLLNEGPRPAVFVRVAELPRAVARRFVNNLLIGSGRGDPALADAAQGNFNAAPGALQPDLRLPADSTLRGRGVAPGVVQGVALSPAAEFMPPAGTRPVKPPERWSPGAYQPN